MRLIRVLGGLCALALTCSVSALPHDIVNPRTQCAPTDVVCIQQSLLQQKKERVPNKHEQRERMAVSSMEPSRDPVSKIPLQCTSSTSMSDHVGTKLTCNPGSVCVDPWPGDTTGAEHNLLLHAGTFDEATCMPVLKSDSSCVNEFVQHVQYHFDDDDLGLAGTMTWIEGCPNGGTCQNGTCAPKTLCTDSDGSNMALLKSWLGGGALVDSSVVQAGSVTTGVGAAQQLQPDSCKVPDGPYLTEYACDDAGQLVMETIDCRWLDPSVACVLDTAGQAKCDISEADLPDNDGDFIVDVLDNCPNIANPGQADLDLNGYGDACEPCPVAHILTPQEIHTVDEDVNGFFDSCEFPQAFSQHIYGVSADGRYVWTNGSVYESFGALRIDRWSNEGKLFEEPSPFMFDVLSDDARYLTWPSFNDAGPADRVFDAEQSISYDFQEALDTHLQQFSCSVNFTLEPERGQYSADGRYYFLSSDDITCEDEAMLGIYRFDQEEQVLEPVLLTGTSYENVMAVSSDGHTIVVNENAEAGGKKLSLYSFGDAMTTPFNVNEYNGASWFIDKEVTVSADASHVVYMQTEFENQEIFTSRMFHYNATTQTTTMLSMDTSEIHSSASGFELRDLILSHDGQYVAFEAQSLGTEYEDLVYRVCVANVFTQTVACLKPPKGLLIDFSRDGRYIAYREGAKNYFTINPLLWEPNDE